ncbi:unnamed protein product [Urochloa humidicola]
MPQQPTPFDERNLKQAQDSIDNSFFDFSIGGLLDEDEVQSAVQGTSEAETPTPESTTPALAADVRNRLSDMQILLEQDVSTLIEDAEPIRRILHQLRTHLPREVQAAIIPAAYIEGHQIRFVEGKKRISDQQNRESLIKEAESKRELATATKDKIKFLESSRSSMVAKIDRLKAQKVALSKELQSVSKELEEEENRLRQLPIEIDDLSKILKVQASEAFKLHRSIPSTQDSIDDYQRIIDEVDQICQKALNAISALL